MFSFKGALEISKSWLNRALIIQSFDFEQMQIEGDSSADDVVLMKKALADFRKGEKIFFAGLGGTTFRFLAFRLSRENGSFFIHADQKLLQRPQQEIVHILQQLGVIAELRSDGLSIVSQGWKNKKIALEVSVENSSQFISALLLSSICLPFDLEINLTGNLRSEDYLKYTIELLIRAGIQIDFQNSRIFVGKNQKILSQKLTGELDVSSAFSLISAGLLSGKVQIENWSSHSLQPDMAFLKCFDQMGIRYLINQNEFIISQQEAYQSLDFNLQSCPDLFPVLSVVCAFASGRSRLYGAPQLRNKESNRILKTCELLRRCEFEVQELPDGIEIVGNPNKVYLKRDFILFDPAHDHRMAMAATLLKLKGFPLKIEHPDVINKSFPQFYQHLGINL